MTLSTECRKPCRTNATGWEHRRVGESQIGRPTSVRGIQLTGSMTLGRQGCWLQRAGLRCLIFLTPSCGSPASIGTGGPRTRWF
jgi:hypothetical protein